ncbi:MAG: phage antirepressor [Firmicutes bacterium]|nr:phage antirepressor [Bacillota bacterium]
MNNLTTYENANFGKIRTVEINGEPWFVGKDVAEILGYERPTKAILDHVDMEDRDEVPIQDSIGRMQNTPIMNESGLYSLIMSSKLSKAKDFKRWVTSEVLPQIRKHGGYLTPSKIEEVLADPDTIIRLATDLKTERQKRQELQEKVEEMQPKALFADSVAASDTSILIGEMAKILKQNGVENMGQNRLFEWLRVHGYLISRKGSDYNSPTQKSMELGLMEIKLGSRINADGTVITTKTMKITGQGQIYFINKFVGKLACKAA